jgi:hypothetical protein
MNATLASTPIVDPWTFHMQRGNFAAAWEICDDVMRARRGTSCSHLPRHEQWLWDGTPLDGKRVLIRCYHGLGDTVQFIRFAAQVKAIAREITVCAQPKLLPILSTVPGIDRLVPLNDGACDLDFDVAVESMELAHVCRITPDTLPNTVPYLCAPNIAPLNIGHSTAGRLDVGIVWSVSDWDRHRVVPIRDLAPLMQMPGVCLHVLQRGAAEEEWPHGVGRMSGGDSVNETAALMCALDLVISVDSFPAHLAGALGVPVWTLLPYDANWRWMVERSDSPWYPTMRLFRQQRAGEWAAVIARVADELSAQIEQRKTEPLSRGVS